jgi:hypothetical protein
MRRSPQDVICTLSQALKEGRKGDEYLIVDLAKQTDMHYVTVNNYLTMIEYIQSNIPRFEKVDQKGNTKIIISDELEMDISESERLLLKMFDRGIVGKNTAVASEPFEGLALERSVTEGDVVRTGPKIYLSRSGMMKAADLAEKREERIMRSPVKAYSEISVEELLTDTGHKNNKADRS